jgi:uncharacterized protein
MERKEITVQNEYRSALIIVTIVALILVFGGVYQQTVRAQQPEQPTPTLTQEEILRTVSVSAMGLVRGGPDMAVVVVGVQTEAETAGEALSENNRQMSALLQVLQDAGIDSDDIQTHTLRLSPRFGNRPLPQQQQPEIIGYTAINTVQVQVRDLDQLGEVLDAAIQEAGNILEGLRFEISDPGPLLVQAREEAMNNARQKAEQLAELAGTGLGEVMTIVEIDRTQPRTIIGVPEMPAVEDAVPIEPGMETLTVEVHVTWMLSTE